jgi:hypothetical protein
LKKFTGAEHLKKAGVADEAHLRPVGQVRGGRIEAGGCGTIAQTRRAMTTRAVHVIQRFPIVEFGVVQVDWCVICLAQLRLKGVTQGGVMVINGVAPSAAVRPGAC